MLPCSLLNMLQCRVVCELVRERLAEHTEPVRERNGVTTRDVAPLQKRHGRATVRYLVRYLWRDVSEEARREFGSGQMLYQWNTPIAPLLDDDEQDHQGSEKAGGEGPVGCPTVG